MKCIVLILLAIMVVSCGKKSENDDPNQVTTTPPISAEDPVNIIENEKFSVTSDKDEYLEGEAILLKVKNLGKAKLDNLAFKFGSEPSNSVVSNLNCFSKIEPEAECMFSVVLQNPIAEYQKVNITYDQLGSNIRLQLNVKVIVDDQNQDVHFLYRKDHTFTDCEKLFKYQDYGVVSSVDSNDLCRVRGKHWSAEKKVQIDVDPMKEFNDPTTDNNKHYCRENWTMHSMQFEAAEVEEKKNIFGATRTVEIPAGESREVCVKWGIFRCKTKKVFYSRLNSVNCY